MTTKSPLLLMTIALPLLGCKSAQDHETAHEATGEAPAMAANAVAEQPDAKSAQPVQEDDKGEIIWADEAFLAEAGVKEGKDVIYLPTPPMVIDKMIEMAEVKKTDLVYDLGTGDGRIAIEVARQTGCRAIGYEIDPELVKQARENVKAAGLEDLVTIEEQDILKLDFRPADVVLMYLDPELNVRLIPQLIQLKDGARIVSHDWGMQDKIVADLVIDDFRSKVPDFVNSHKLYRWTAPLNLKE